LDCNGFDLWLKVNENFQCQESKTKDFRHLATKMRHRNVPGQANLNEIDAMVKEIQSFAKEIIRF